MSSDPSINDECLIFTVVAHVDAYVSFWRIADLIGTIE
jgi:hypothetical protein